MDQISPATRARTIVGVIAAVVLVISFALVATLINRGQINVGQGGPVCPNANAKPSSLVGVHFTTSSLTRTYYFDSLVNLGNSGTPGLIEYCVFTDVTGLGTVTATAHGANGDAFQSDTGTDGFSFVRHTGGGNNSNVPLDGTTHEMGMATWSPSLPATQTFKLHINDNDECHSLFPDLDPAESTCWVTPTSGQTPTPTPTPTNTPAGVPTPTNTPNPHDPTATPHGK
jgi:hypothetical protein